jgi:ABC-type polysaccharide/polyol phosphate transport system ATPase subunit
VCFNIGVGFSFRSIDYVSFDCSRCSRRLKNIYPILCLGREKQNIQHIHALLETSLELKRGEWIWIVGPNGSGKTTLMRILAGLLEPDSGHVNVSGEMACFFDLGVGFHDERNAYENIKTYGLLPGIHPKEIQILADRIIDFAGVREHARLPLKCYSTGLRMRLAYAAAAHVHADIHLFDEAIAVADEEFRERCYRYLRGLKLMGKSAILAAPRMGGAMEARLCDRCFVLEKGELTEKRDVRESFARSFAGSVFE